MDNWPFKAGDRVRQISTGLEGTVWSSMAPVTNHVTGDTTWNSTVMLDRGGVNNVQCWLESIRESTVEDWEMVNAD